ncbi:MAG: zinc ribbon domain-containing protein [Candidatus Aenigmarchaeota archaeon]|nr:zinc ribbon domain-containing protein [Candidatus Aenigmarchaeota archaeon]
MAYRIKALIIFVIGVIIAASGIVILIQFPDLFQENTKTYSFAIMLVGLVFVAFGAVWGKKRIVKEKKKGDFFSQAMKKFDDKGKGKKEEKPKEKRKGRGFFGRMKDKKEKPEEPAKEELSGKKLDSFLNTAEKNVVKIYICPGCGSENPEGHKFCSECGKKLKFLKPPKKGKK